METVINKPNLNKTNKKKTIKDKAINWRSSRRCETNEILYGRAFIALLVGGILGLLQGLERAGLLQLPSWFNYYQVLTAHGILLVLVLTAFFTIGYFYAGTFPYTWRIIPKVRKMAWIGFWMKIVGFVVAVIPVLMNEASVMYTFYPPMAASPFFYIGLAFIVLGVWMCAFGAFHQRCQLEKKQSRKAYSDFCFLCNWCICSTIFRKYWRHNRSFYVNSLVSRFG